MGRCYPHLSLEERRKIANWRFGKIPVPEIADRLDRNASSIYREIKRNSCRFDINLNWMDIMRWPRRTNVKNAVPSIAS